MCLLDVALLIRNSVQEADLDCHCSCLLYSLASILQWRLQHEEAGADCVVTPSKLQETLEILESAIANTAHQGCWILSLDIGNQEYYCTCVLEEQNILYHLPWLSKFLQLFAVSNDQFKLTEKRHHHTVVWSISTYLWWWTISRRLELSWVRLEAQTPGSWTIKHHGVWCKTLRLLKYCHLQFWTISHCLQSRSAE